MDRPTWDRIQEIYHSTLPMPPMERSAFVARACDQNTLLLHELNSLLEAEASAGDFLESTAFDLGLKIISSGARQNATDQANVDHLIGATISARYLIEKELGRGGIGRVYLARDLELHSRPVVIKILLEASLQNPYVVKKFRQEVEALARIDHPNVVNVLGAGELEDRKPFIVMQWVSGVTLRSEIPSEGMNLERTAAILKQLGAALDDVHERRIFHRDLKPDNIMLQVKSGNELVKVVDFGIAKVKDSVVAPSTINEVPVGTLLYMSPEQLRGGNKITAASDIYSMGVIAYEMITGRRPFNPESGPQLLEMHRAGVRVKPTDLRHSVSTEAQAIVLRALSFDPAARYQSAAEFGNSLARALMAEEQPTRREYSGSPASDPYPTTINAPATIQSGGNESPIPVAISPDNAPVDSKVRDDKRTQFNRNRFALVGLLIVLCIGGLSAVIYKYLEKRPASRATPTRSLNYGLTVQRMRDGRKYQGEFPSTGEEVFETGYRFRLRVTTPEAAYLYVFSEGPPLPDGTTFTIVYPTPQINNGSAAIGADQPMLTNWNTFKGDAGTENFWLVWTTSPVPELESVKAAAFKRPNGAITDQDLVNVRQFLATKEDEAKVRTSRDKTNQVVTLTGNGDVLAKMVQFSHR